MLSKKWCFLKFRKFRRKTLVLEYLFNNVAATILKRDSKIGVFLSNLRDFLGLKLYSNLPPQTHFSGILETI